MGVLNPACGKTPNYTFPSAKLEMGCPSHGGLDASRLSFNSRGKLIYDKIMAHNLERKAYDFILYIWLAME